SNPRTPAKFERRSDDERKDPTIGVSPSGKAPDSDSGIPRFESSYPSHIKKARFGELFAFLPGAPGGGVGLISATLSGTEYPTTLTHTSGPDVSTRLRALPPSIRYYA